jgi:hypothetical protein
MNTPLNITVKIEPDQVREAVAATLLDPDLWPTIAHRIDSPHQYDLDDTSEATDVVQIVCEAIACLFLEMLASK